MKCVFSFRLSREIFWDSGSYNVASSTAFKRMGFRHHRVTLRVRAEISIMFALIRSNETMVKPQTQMYRA